MSLQYVISPELNVILYVGKGYITPSEFFSLEQAAFQQNHRPRGMITLVDASEIVTDFSLADIHRFIENIRELNQDGMDPGPYVMVTLDHGIHLLAKAVNLMAGQLDLKIRIYTSMQEAITGLGMSDHSQEIVEIWQKRRNNSAVSIGGE